MEIRAGRLLVGSFGHSVPDILQILGAKILLVRRLRNVVIGIPRSVVIGNQKVLSAEIPGGVPLLGLRHRGVASGGSSAGESTASLAS
jgi:hypothetical protein